MHVIDKNIQKSHETRISYSTEEYIEIIDEFHGVVSPGAIIGFFMFNIARRLLNFNENESLYVTCETSSCIPDALQVLGGCTIGNGKLKILNYGKMAVTINKPGEVGENVTGVRIILDHNKTKDYPIIHEWYLNKKKVPFEEVNPELFKAGENIYSWKYVDVIVPSKEKKRIRICKKCNEPFIQHNLELLCSECYFNKR